MSEPTREDWRAFDAGVAASGGGSVTLEELCTQRERLYAKIRELRVESDRIFVEINELYDESHRLHVQGAMLHAKTDEEVT